MSGKLFLILFFCCINSSVLQTPHWLVGCDIDRFKNFTYCDTDSKLVAQLDTYSDTECVYYVIPYRSLAAFQCPFTVTRMSEADNNCYTFFYPNGTILTINLKMRQAPRLYEAGILLSTQPFNGQPIFLLCPLYGTPTLSYNWTIPINGYNLTDLGPALLYEQKNSDSDGFGTQASNLFFDEEGCPSGLQILYSQDLNIDGAYYCSGSNEYGTETVLVTIINNDFLCVSSSNLAFDSASNRVLELEDQRKVSPGEIGTNITVTCRLVPFSSNVNMFWIRTVDLELIPICSGGINSNPYVLNTDSKYSVSSVMESLDTSNYHGPNCTKALSLTIHSFMESDEIQYSCLADICSPGVTGSRLHEKVSVSGDKEVTKDLIWILSFVSVPVIGIAVSLVVAGILIYVYKVRLIRWYIAWKREEPIGPFEYDVFVCTPEEYNGDFVDEVRSELIDKLSGVRVMWLEHDMFNLAGRNHYVNACQLIGRCRKFVFVVDTRFQECFFCKLMTELVVEESSVKNWNIILPVKWYPDSCVPGDLLVYRYVDRVDACFLSEIECFIQSKGVTNRNERRIGNECEMTEINESSFSLKAPLISQNS